MHNNYYFLFSMESNLRELMQDEMIGRFCLPRNENNEFSEAALTKCHCLQSCRK